MKKTASVLVLGGRGFIGRHAVEKLKSAGASVTIGTRNPGASDEVQVRLEKLTHVRDWIDIAKPYDTILNCVGILRQRPRESYESIHHDAPHALAQACAAAGIRFVHVSALGLSKSARSRFLTSKYRGEQAIMKSGDDWIIARPSLLDGERGFGAEWLRGIARLPVFAVPTSARGKIAALTVQDAGEALARLCVSDSAALDLERSRIFELGGPLPVGFEDYIRGLRRRHSSSRALAVPVPSLLARVGAHICDLLHFSPFSFGHWELLCRDNVPDENRLPELLRREPTHVVPPPTQ